MKRFWVFLFLSIFTCAAFGQQDVASIRKEMAKIRQSTNWNDAAAAKKANEQIKELSKKLMSAGNNQGNTNTGQSQNQSGSKDKPNSESQKVQQDIAADKMKMWEQIMKSAAGGKGADILLAEPIREEIKEEYKAEESSKTSSPQMLEEMTFLCLDMSSPTVQLIIDQMENYKSIKTLVITGGKFGVPVDLRTLFSKAENYPLKQLYIINFRIFVKDIPKEVGQFSKLNLLALYNNQISKLPPEISTLTSLKKLYVDMNPIEVMTPAVNSLSLLDTLGIAKTKVSETEITKIEQLLPNCNILLK